MIIYCSILEYVFRIWFHNRVYALLHSEFPELLSTDLFQSEVINSAFLYRHNLPWSC